MRFTKTNIPERRYKEINDFWTREGDEELGFEWIGATRFTLLKTAPPNGYYWVEGRLTRKQKTTRPDNCWPETWSILTPKEKEEAVILWAKEQPEREQERDKRKIWKITDEDEDHYHKCLSEAILNMPKVPDAPTMLTMKMKDLIENQWPTDTMLPFYHCLNYRCHQHI